MLGFINDCLCEGYCSVCDIGVNLQDIVVLRFLIEECLSFQIVLDVAHHFEGISRLSLGVATFDNKRLKFY